MRFFVAFLLFSLSALVGFAQPYDEIASAISDGNATALATHFDVTVELSIDDEVSSLGRSDAENKMRSFFMENEPRLFEIVHRGESKGGVQYCIGQLLTTQGAYQATLYLHESMDQYLIQSIEIEHD